MTKLDINIYLFDNCVLLKDSVTQCWLEVNSNHWLKRENFCLSAEGSESLCAKRKERKTWLKVRGITVVCKKASEGLTKVRQSGIIKALTLASWLSRNLFFYLNFLLVIKNHFIYI